MRNQTILFLLFMIVLALAILPSSSASLLSWISGKATQPTNISIPVSALAVNWVSVIASPQNVTEGGLTNINFYFTATLPGGNISNVNDSSARANFTKTSEDTRENLSCAWLQDLDINPADGTDDTANYSCTIGMWYWDGAGNWTVTAAIADNVGNWAFNNSRNMTLSESTCFVRAPAELTWTSVVPGTSNQMSNNDPSLLNNTCNDDIAAAVEIKALDLIGETNNTYSILATAFKSHTATGGLECSAGTSLVNNTFQAITGSILPAGNNSKNYENETSGQEQLYYCIPSVNASLISQTYSTDALGSWTIQINT